MTYLTLRTSRNPGNEKHGCVKNINAKHFQSFRNKFVFRGLFFWVFSRLDDADRITHQQRTPKVFLISY